MIKTTYKPTTGTADGYWTYDTIRQREKNVPGIARVRQIELPAAYKVMVVLALMTVVTFVIALRNWLWDPTGATGVVVTVVQSLIAGFVISGSVFVLMNGLPEKKAIAAPRGMTDEISAIVKNYRKLLSLRQLMPEGAGIRERVDEYGRLAFNLLGECARLPDMDGSHSHFFQVQNQIQIEAKRLADSGRDLIGLISSRRAENTLESVKTLGIQEYAEHVSIETMAHRALSAGDAGPKAKTFKDEWWKKQYR